MKVSLCKDNKFSEGGLYCMIQYAEKKWMRVSNKSDFESDNLKYIKKYFENYLNHEILGDKANVSDSQMTGCDIIKIIEVEGEIPTFKVENFHHRNGDFYYEDENCNTQINMSNFPEIYSHIKQEFYAKLKSAKKAGGELTHISNKGMGKVKVPRGTIVNGSKAILPDGRYAESKSQGSGVEFGYSWYLTTQKIPVDSPDFDWWNWTVLNNPSISTTIFGCRNGEADILK